MKKLYPLPEAITPGNWQIKEDIVPRANLQKKRMYLVLANDPQWRNVRAHELAHAAFSPVERPPRPKGVSERTLQSLEDYRVNTLAASAGVDFSAGSPSHIMQSAILMTKGNPADAILLTLAAFPGERRKVLEQVLALNDSKYGPLIRNVVLAAQSAMSPLTYEATEKTAEWLEPYVRRAVRRIKMAGLRDDGESEDGWPTESEEEDDGATESEGKASRSGTPWGTMYIERPALGVRHHRALARTLPTDEGSLFRSPWRVTVDGRVFQRVKATARASVLIDASGSMSLSAAQIKSIVKAAPASVIAAYAGAGTRGPLRILAERGLMTETPKDYKFPVGNIVDVPALEWLATQPEPRYWISDGGVTGNDDQSIEAVEVRAWEIVRSARITRLEKTADLTQVLKGKR